MSDRRQKYQELIEAKRHVHSATGFAPVWMPDQAFDYPRALIEWATTTGRAALLADCGLGKSLMQLVYGENVVRKTNRPVLALAPLGVAGQTVIEAEKFGIDAVRSSDGKFTGKRIVVTNYERLHHFDPAQFAGLICDESSILKNADGATRQAVNDFARKMSFRLLCTATPAPNDLIELGTSSEALGYLGFNDMLTTFFKKDDDSGRATTSRKDEFRSGVWRFRGHAEIFFFRWVCSWARALRKPSDLGFSDGHLKLPKLITNEHVVDCETPPDGWLFTVPANGLGEQRAERRRTIEVRCEKAAVLHNAHDEPGVAWCQLNDEGDILAKEIKGAVQLSGADKLERKEEILEGFVKGHFKKLVTKPTIAGFGLNWQHCAHQTQFPSHSWEQFYQTIRRSWRFGQERPVRIDLITSEGERGVMANLMRKNHNAEVMMTNLVQLMWQAQ
ncbi:MAG: helicase, partial [Roseimicrobium sp.]